MDFHIRSLFAVARTMVLAFVLSGLISGCGDDSPEDVPLDDIQINLKVVRLEEDMLAAAEAYAADSTADSMAIYLKFFQDDREFIRDWMFFGNEEVATDSAVAVLMSIFASDPRGLELLDTIHTRLATVDIEGLLLNPLKRLKHYFPDRPTPVVVTYADGYPYTAQAGLDQIFISPKFLGIGMQYFMGPSFQYYPPDLPSYIRRRFEPEYIPALVAHKYADYMIPPPPFEGNPVLIDHVVHAGMQMYFVDKLLGPQTPDSVKLFYTSSQMDWADTYESRAFKDMLPNVYEIDAETVRRYIEDSPFTSQLNRESAPRLGDYLGWKIVSAFMEKHPDITLGQLVMRKDYQQIFKEAQYRPGGQN